MRKKINTMIAELSKSSTLQERITAIQNVWEAIEDFPQEGDAQLDIDTFSKGLTSTQDEISSLTAKLLTGTDIVNSLTSEVSSLSMKRSSSSMYGACASIKELVNSMPADLCEQTSKQALLNELDVLEDACLADDAVSMAMGPYYVLTATEDFLDDCIARSESYGELGTKEETLKNISKSSKERFGS